MQAWRVREPRRVAVYEQTPDAETLLLNNTGPTAATEEEAEEEAEAALSTVDSEFGRTTDPVRMYMREMGTVELLTREGEIEIAKRIEGGLMDMMEAISASPATIAAILEMAATIRRALAEETGDLLAFLPGVGEIERTAERLEGIAAQVHRLHGSLDPAEQRAAIRKSETRKVILATSIAETSLTIDGVRIVVDSGL
eukprot:gene54972-73433_t